jgi:hypothetical protein
MNINRVTLCGYTGKDARTSSTQNGKSNQVVRRDNQALQGCRWKLARENKLARVHLLLHDSRIRFEDPDRYARVPRRRARVPRVRPQYRDREWSGKSTLAHD